MNLATLSGVYENSRTLSRALGDGTHLQDRITRILNNPAARQEFVEALSALEGHLRVMGFDEVIQVAVK
jgi:hypothetical protein